MPLLNDGPGSVVIDDVTSRAACPGLLYTPPSLDSTPMSKQCHKVRCAEMWSAKEKTVSQAQTWLKRKKSNVVNKFVDVAMENMYCKIIAFARFHLYFAILYFCLQKVHSFSFWKTLFFCIYIYVALHWFHINPPLKWRTVAVFYYLMCTILYYLIIPWNILFIINHKTNWTESFLHSHSE